MISIAHLSKRYGQQVVFHDWSATLTTGQCTCILGPSGQGKTTLLRILMGLESADSGQISGLEQLVPSAVFQEDRLCENLDIVTNLLLPHMGKPSPLTRAHMAQGLEALQLSDHQEKLVRELSGGMKRRVTLLRALLVPYDILFLDEPFKGLDGAIKEKTMDYLKENTQGKTVLCITHDQGEVAYLAPHATLILTP